MGIDIRTKGATAEREVCDALNAIIRHCLQELGEAVPDKPIVQRNQNQTAVGGKDLSNTFDLAIEVKRQEQLSVNTWWKQCVSQAERNNEKPVLIYRQNRQAWRVVMLGNLGLPSLSGSGEAHMKVRCEISWEDFKVWFTHYAKRKIQLEGLRI